MSTTDPNPNPSTRSGWASPAPASPDSTRDPATPPPSTRVGAKARTVVGGIVPRLIGLAVALALAFGGYWFFVVHKDSQAVADSIPATGTCFQWVETNNTGAKVLPCSDPAATYKTEGSSTGSDAAASATCDAVGAYVEFGVSVSSRNDSQSGTICAALNLTVGACVSDAGANPEIVGCDDPAAGADGKVLSLQKVATAAETLSDTKAVAVCGSAATKYLSDTAGTTIVCIGKP